MTTPATNAVAGGSDPMAKLKPISAQPRSRLAESWIGFVTTVRREIHRVLRIWMQTVFSPLITTSLYFLVFGLVLGTRLREIDGVPYIEFVVPGLS